MRVLFNCGLILDIIKRPAFFLLFWPWEIHVGVGWKVGTTAIRAVGPRLKRVRGTGVQGCRLVHMRPRQRFDIGEQRDLSNDKIVYLLQRWSQCHFFQYSSFCPQRFQWNSFLAYYFISTSFFYSSISLKVWNSGWENTRNSAKLTELGTRSLFPGSLSAHFISMDRYRSSAHLPNFQVRSLLHRSHKNQWFALGKEC